MESHPTFYQIILIYTSNLQKQYLKKRKRKKEKKHFQDKSEIEDKNVEERKCSSPDTGILSDKKRGSESLYTVDKLAVPSGTDT